MISEADEAYFSAAWWSPKSEQPYAWRRQSGAVAKQGTKHVIKPRLT